MTDIVDEKDGVKPRIQGARWRKLDNTAKLFAAVAGEDLSNVFRLSVSLKAEVKPHLLSQALERTLPEFENFRVKLRKGFFWNYFETNNREPLIEKEETYPCKFIDPHESHRFPFRVSYYGKRINFEVFHGLTDGLGALNFLKSLTEHYLELCLEETGRDETPGGPGGSQEVRKSGKDRKMKETGQKQGTGKKQKDGKKRQGRKKQDFGKR